MSNWNSAGNPALFFCATVSRGGSLLYASSIASRKEIGMSRFQAVVFDMDGVIFDSERIYRLMEHRTAARYGLSQELFREIVTCLKYVLPATEKRDILPISLKWEIFDPASEFYIPHAAGVKSGYTSTAGFCYVGAYQENGVTLIAAVMGGRTRNMAWTDLKRLFAYGMAVTE